MWMLLPLARVDVLGTRRDAIVRTVSLEVQTAPAVTSTVYKANRCIPRIRAMYASTRKATREKRQVGISLELQGGKDFSSRRQQTQQAGSHTRREKTDNCASKDQKEKEPERGRQKAVPPEACRLHAHYMSAPHPRNLRRKAACSYRDASWDQRSQTLWWRRGVRALE